MRYLFSLRNTTRGAAVLIRHILAMLVFALILAVGCGKKQTALPTAPALEPVTEAEAREFGKEFLAAVAAKDRAKYDRLVRFDEFFHRCMRDSNLSMADRNEIVKALEPIVGDDFAHFSLVYDADSAKILDVRSRDGKMEVSMRLKHNKYLVLELKRHPDGAVAMQDSTSTHAGEPDSKRYRRRITPFLMKYKGAALSEQDSLYLQHLDAINAAGEAAIKKESGKAMALLNGLPTELQREKSIAQMRLNIALVIYESNAQRELEREMERYMELFPDDTLSGSDPTGAPFSLR